MNVFRPPPKPDPVRETFAQARRELSAALIEREEEVDLALTALVAGEHLLLVGPPGCGKSLLLDSVLSWTGGTRFTVLLTKFTTVEELIGPVSLAGLKEDRYVRVTAGKLPEADFGFIDEVFKGSSAILNMLLKILNERTFDAGDGVVRTVPLELCVAASNEWPSPDTGKELSALFDRFVLRAAVAPIRSRAGRERLLWAADHTPVLSARLAPGELAAARRAAAALPWSAAAKEALEAVLAELAQRGGAAGRPAAVQDRRRGAGVRVPVRRRAGRAGAPRGRAALPVGRPPGAAREGGAGDREDRQPDRDAGHPVAPGGRGGAGRDRRAQPGRRREGRGQAGRDRPAVRGPVRERPRRGRPGRT